MSEKFYSDLLFILVVLIVTAILGFLVGWLMRSIKIKSLKDSLDACYKANENLKKEFDLKEENDFLSFKDQKKSEFTYSTFEEETIFDGAMAKLAFGKKIVENDLKVVEGIGPKIEKLLRKNNVNVWNDLANSTVSSLQDILNSGGDRYKLHKPHTWPKQAKLAATGKWSELKQLQDVLDGGR